MEARATEIKQFYFCCNGENGAPWACLLGPLLQILISTFPPILCLLSTLKYLAKIRVKRIHILRFTAGKTPFRHPSHQLLSQHLDVGSWFFFSPHRTWTRLHFSVELLLRERLLHRPIPSPARSFCFVAGQTTEESPSTTSSLCFFVFPSVWHPAGAKQP